MIQAHLWKNSKKQKTKLHCSPGSEKKETTGTQISDLLTLLENTDAVALSTFLMFILIQAVILSFVTNGPQKSQ